MSKAIILVSIIGVLFVVSIVVGVIVMNQKGFFETEPVKNITQVELFVSAEDIDTRQNLDANYILTYNDSIVSQGQLKSDSLTPLTLDSDKLYTFNCWNDDYYLVKASRIFSQAEVEAKKARFTCSMVKIGNLEVTTDDQLKVGQNEITYHIKSLDGWTYKLSGCISWSAGIIDANVKSNVITCEKANWLNWSTYNATTMKYNYLDEGLFRCGDEIEKCETVEDNRCKLNGLEIPKRFIESKDSCFSTGKTLSPNEEFNLTIEYKTLDIVNQLDFLDVVWFDLDRRYSSTENKFIWVNDVGQEDKLVTVEP